MGVLQTNTHLFTSFGFRFLMVGHCSVHSWRLKVQWVLATWVTSPLTTSLWHAPCAAGPLSLLTPPPQDIPPTVSQAWVFLLSATLALISLSHSADTQVSIPFVESPELSNIPSGKPGVGQNLALHASPAARNSAFLHHFFFLKRILFSFVVVVFLLI